MSQQRQPVSEEEFAGLVADYYLQKQAYSKQFEALLNQRLATHPNPIPNMPVHASEEDTTGNLTDQVAKDSQDSTASSHSLHDVDTGAKSAPHATVEDHKANPGLVQTSDLPEAASKEELKERAAELNK